MTGDDRRPFILLALLVLLAGSAFFWLAQTTPDVADTIGYVHAGQRIAAGEGPTLEDAYNRQIGPFFSMFAFQIRRSGDARLFFGFPPGFPLLLGAAAWLTGQPLAVHYVAPLLAVLSLFVVFFLGRLMGQNGWTGLWAALLLAATPALWRYGTAAWATMPSLFFLAAGAVLYLRSREVDPARAPPLSLTAGLLLGFSFFSRYANAVTIVPALTLYELITARTRILSERWRWPFFLSLGAAFGAMLIFNQLYYGGPFTTSYSAVHGWYPFSPFSLDNALGPEGQSLLAIGKTLWENFSLLLLLAPVGWLYLPRKAGMLATTAVLSTIALYAVYAFAAQGVNARFLVPAFPFVTIGIAEAFVALGRRLPGARWRWSGGLALVALLSLALPGRVGNLRARNAASEEIVARAEQMAQRTAPDAVFLAYGLTDPLIYYGDRSVLNYRRIPPSDAEAGRFRWELLEPCMAQIVRRLMSHGHPVYYVEDSSPPLAGSLEILQRYYSLELIQEAPNLYRVRAAPDGAPQPGICPLIEPE